MSTATISKMADEHLLKIYNRFPIALDHGEGVYLYDADGKKYLDFQAGIAVCSLGYSNEKYKSALKDQIDKLTHTSNLYYNDVCADAANSLARISGMERVFFTNSGTEAIEGLIKTVRKYAYEKDGSTDHEIIAMEHSFHGRSMGALSVTYNPHYREAFEPLIGNIRFAKFNDIESVKALINDKTCAILTETVQAEGGIYPADEEFLKQLRQICDEKDILLVFDEIQCGMGRCGDYFAWQGYGVKPDCMAVAKAIGNGIPVGAFLMTDKVANASLKPGDHGTTYGGNPFAAAAVRTVIEIFEEEKIVENVKTLAPYLEAAVEELKAAHPDAIKERRGRGFLQGIELKVPVGEVIAKAQAAGLLTITAEGNVLRLLPPLVIGREHIDEMKNILDKILT